MYIESATAEDHFGYSLSLSDDVLIAANLTTRGAAHVFGRDVGGEGAWGEEEVLVASDEEDGDGFGWDVAFSGDTAVVTALWKNGGGTERGAAYVFQLVPESDGVSR